MVAADPSLRGLMGTLTTALQGVSTSQASLQDLQGSPSRAWPTYAGQPGSAGKPTFFSWRTLITGGKPDARELRHVILVDPSLDFARLEAGKAPTSAIREAARTLNLDAAHGVTVRLTGPVPLEDEELATLADRVVLIAFLGRRDSDHPDAVASGALGPADPVRS